MNSVARSLALRALRWREVSDRLQRRPAAAAAYSTDPLAAYQYRSDSGYLLLPLVAVGAGTWVIATAATRYFMTPPTHQAAGTTTTTPVEGPRPEVAASPTN